MKQILWYTVQPDQLLELLDCLVYLPLVSIHLTKQPMGVKYYVWLVLVLEAFREQALGEDQVTKFEVCFGAHDVELPTGWLFLPIVILKCLLRLLLALLILALQVELLASLQESTQGLVLHRLVHFDRAGEGGALL